jgi:multiple sugar transport system ATP-binding protein
VAGFIGSPAMNLFQVVVAADGDGVAVDLAGTHLRVPPETLADHEALRGFVGRSVVLGIRPEDMEDAQLVSDAPQDRRITITADLREALGSDVVVHFTLDTPPAVTEDVQELKSDVGHEALQDMQLKARSGVTSAVARLNPRTSIRTGTTAELVIDTHRLHFFDPDNGAAIYGSDGAT